MQPAKLIIKRTKQYANSARGIGIYIDNKKIGNIADGETRTIDIPEGRHEISAKIDWCKTRPLAINIKANEVKEIELGSPVLFSKISMVLIACSLLAALFGGGYSELASVIFLASAIIIDLIIYKRTFLSLLYYITFGSHKYLYLKDVSSKISERILTEEVTQLNTSSKSYKFLEEDQDLYTVNDLKVKYGK